MHKARLTTKFQATIPKEVRNILHLKAKDQIIYEITDQEVRLRKATPLDLDYLDALKHTMNEWNTKEDEEAYKNL